MSIPKFIEETEDETAANDTASQNMADKQLWIFIELWDLALPFVLMAVLLLVILPCSIFPRRPIVVFIATPPSTRATIILPIVVSLIIIRGQRLLPIAFPLHPKEASGASRRGDEAPSPQLESSPCTSWVM